MPFGMAFLAQALKPRDEDHHCPADERAAQAHDKERDNRVHIRSYRRGPLWFCRVRPGILFGAAGGARVVTRVRLDSGTAVHPDEAARGEPHAASSFWTDASGGWGVGVARAVMEEIPQSGRTREREHESSLSVTSKQLRNPVSQGGYP
jgi:hypothetical protein